MLRQKRKEVEVFSLSFMDCICCGFGAVLLLFILTTGQKTNFTETDLTDLRDRIAAMEREISDERTEIERLAKALAIEDVNLDGLREESTDKETKISQRKNELQLLLQQVSTLKDALAKLLEEQQAIPTQEEPPAISIPNVDRRQYLTGIRMEGEHVLFIVRASGSMLDETIEGARARQSDPDF
jgi:predicted nuclease with TOPRIM domain